MGKFTINVQNRIDVIPLNPGCLRMELSPFFSAKGCFAQLNEREEQPKWGIFTSYGGFLKLGYPTSSKIRPF